MNQAQAALLLVTREFVLPAFDELHRIERCELVQLRLANFIE